MYISGKNLYQTLEKITLKIGSGCSNIQRHANCDKDKQHWKMFTIGL